MYIHVHMYEHMCAYLNCAQRVTGPQMNRTRIVQVKTNYAVRQSATVHVPSGHRCDIQEVAMWLVLVRKKGEEEQCSPKLWAVPWVPALF